MASEDHARALDDDDAVELTVVPVTTDVAFADFYRGHYHQLVRMASFLVESVEYAEDIVQEVFVKVQRRWARIDDPLHYTRRAVSNACRSHHRRRFLERRHGRHEPREATELESLELLDAVARLPVRQRQAVVLRFYEDLSQNETARIIGCRPGTVGSLIHRAMRTLRADLSELVAK